MSTLATLNSDRVTLRPLQASDAGMITLYASESHLARMTTSIPHPLPPGAAEAFVERSIAPDGEERVWAIMPRDDQRDGLVGLISIDKDAELGYWIGAPFRNTGFATEAVGLLVAHLAQSGMSGINANVFQDNPTSARVLIKAGFEYLGDGRAFSVARGVDVDRWRYRLNLTG